MVMSIEWHDLPPDYSRGTIDGRDRYIIQAVALQSGFQGLEVLAIGRVGDRQVGYARTMRSAKQLAENDSGVDPSERTSVFRPHSHVAEESGPWPRRSRDEDEDVRRHAERAARKALDVSGVEYDKLFRRHGEGEYRFEAFVGRDRKPSALVVVLYDETQVFVDDSEMPRTYDWGWSSTPRTGQRRSRAMAAYEHGYDPSAMEDAGPYGALDWRQDGDDWTARTFGGAQYRLVPDGDDGFHAWYERGGEREDLGVHKTLGAAMSAARSHQPATSRAAEGAREYEAVGSSGKVVGGPYKYHSEAKTEADRHGGYVRWVAASEAGEPRAVDMPREIVGHWNTFKKHQLPNEYQLKRLRWEHTLYRVDAWVGRNLPEGSKKPEVYAVDAKNEKDAERIVIEQWLREKYSGDWTFEAVVKKWPIKDGVPQELPRNEFDFGTASERVPVLYEDDPEVAAVSVSQTETVTVVAAREDWSTKEDAEAHAHAIGARFITGEGRHYYVYIPREGGGYEQRPLFEKDGNWHIGKLHENVKRLPRGARPIRATVSAAAEHEACELRKVNGRWALVSRKTGRPLRYYRGHGKPPKAWVEKQEARIESFRRSSTKEGGAEESHVTTWQRRKLPRSAFALPDRKPPALLMTNRKGEFTKGHVLAAASRLSMMENKGTLKRGEFTMAHTRIARAGRKIGLNIHDVREAMESGHHRWSSEAYEATKLKLLKGGGQRAPMDEFTQAYVTAALWASMDDEGEPLDAKYGVDDIAPQTLDWMKNDCEDFQMRQAELLDAAYKRRYTSEQAGHDFWLTRNHHGAGFWDRGLGHTGDELTEAAHKYGSVDLYVHDGKIYASGHERGSRHGLHAVNEARESSESSECPPCEAASAGAAGAEEKKSKSSESTKLSEAVGGGCVAIVERTPNCVPTGIKMESPRDVYDFMAPRARKLGAERFYVLLVSNQGELLGNPVEVAAGQPDRVGVDIEQIVAAAVVGSAAGARGFLICHFHPSGGTHGRASAADKRLTEDVQASAKIACPSTVFIDHVVVAAPNGKGVGSYYSFEERKLTKVES
jgi:hypothetical protein